LRFHLVQPLLDRVDRRGSAPRKSPLMVRLPIIGPLSLAAMRWLSAAVLTLRPRGRLTSSGPCSPTQAAPPGAYSVPVAKPPPPPPIAFIKRA
jgi:hypothetical protein